MVSQLTATLVGAGSPYLYLVQISTAVLLVLAANTSFADFPRLSSILARDGFLPRVFQFRGDRLAFNAGIVVLAVVAVAADRRVRRQRDEPHPALHGRRVHRVHAQPVGHGPALVAAPARGTGLADECRDQRDRRADDRRRGDRGGGVEVPPRRVDRAHPHPGPDRRDAVHPPPVHRIGGASSPSATTSSSRRRAARSASSSRCRASTGRSSRRSTSGARSPRTFAAVLVSDDPVEAARIRERWERQLPDVPLVVVESPYRALVGPLLAYLDVLDQAWPPDKEAPITFVVIPEYVAQQLVGADPLQPVGQSAAAGIARATAHRRRQRSLSPRRARHIHATGSGGLNKRPPDTAAAPAQAPLPFEFIWGAVCRGR